MNDTRPYAQQATVETDSGDRALAVLAHLSAPIAAIISAGTLSVIGPLIIWLLFRNRPLVRQAAAGAFNFNVAFWVLYLVSWVLIFTVVGAIIGIPLMIVIFVVSAVLHLLGALRSAGGRHFEYPFQIRILH